MLVGRARGGDAPPPAAPPAAPRRVLEALLEEALAHPPCHVLFSGGRDSSAMLAVAAAVARSRGLAPPIPLTAVFPDHPQTWETAWQERTVRHVGLGDWTRAELTTELDALGPVARAALARHGLFAPANAVAMAVFGGLAGGGVVVTGGGGDELFSPWSWRRPRPATLWRLRPRRRAVKWTAFSALPLRTRQRLLARRHPLQLRWLRPEAAATLNARIAAEEPPAGSWRAEIHALLASRYLQCLRAAMGTFAADAGVRLVEPFYDPRFVRAVAASGPRQGPPSRTQALGRLVGDLLPHDVLSRPTKALFTTTAWGPEARAFAGAWDGRGLDESLVDVERVRAEWRREVPDARSLTMLHRAWLAQEAASTVRR